MKWSDSNPEWYELAIAGDDAPLKPISLATWCAIIGVLSFWLGVGVALWWLL